MAPSTRWCALAAGLVLAAVVSLVDAAKVTRPPAVAKVPATSDLRKSPTGETSKEGKHERNEGTKTKEGAEKPEPAVEAADIERLRGPRALNGSVRFGYNEQAAVDAFLSGLVSLFVAERLGFDREFVAEWNNLRLENLQRPTADELAALVDRAILRTRESIEKRLIEEEQARLERMALAEARAQPLSDAAIAALQLSTKGRRAVLDPSMPDVVVKLADDPVHDKAILDHVWFRHALALTETATQDKLHLLNLFPDPVGDSLVRKIDALLGEKPTPKKNAVTLLHEMLTGKRSFEHDALVKALALVQGETIYIVSHIPESTPGTGHLEYGGTTVVSTEVAQLDRAFKAARVNLFIVGCSSAQHASIGLSREILNTDALSGFLHALSTSNDRTLFGWHAAFAGGAKVVIDPLATEIYGKDIATGEVSKVTLEKDGKSVSTGYVGSYGPPQLPEGAAGPTTIPNAVALGSMSIPIDSGLCQSYPTPAQIEVGERWIMLADLALLFTYLIACHAFLQYELTKAPGDKKELLGATLLPLIVCAPIVFCRYHWISHYSIEIVPGPFLPIWSLAYGALSLSFWILRKNKDIRFVFAFFSFSLAGILYGLIYLGFGASDEIQNFCAAEQNAR